jgi:hypothetical protein
MHRCGYLRLLTYLDTCWLSLLFKSLIRASSLNVTWHMHCSLQLEPSCEKKYFLSPYMYTFKEPRNRFQGVDFVSLCSLVGQYVKKS